MKTSSLVKSLVALGLLFNSFQLQAQSDLFVQEDLKLISSQFKFTEGCTPDKAGNVYFTDQPNDKLWKYGVDGKLTVFLDKTGRANGTYFDKKGNLIIAADEKGEFWSVDKKGKPTVIIKDYKGKQLNGPNDLWIDNSGNIFFTDPYYQRDYWTRTKPELPSQSVYFIPKGTKNIVLVADSLNQPNGIVGTPDGKYLYIADAGANKFYRYDIGKDGQLINKKLLINRGADGITLDDRGNIYLSGGRAVGIFSPDGKEIGKISVPEGTSNVCFGGKDKNVLFITAQKSIYSIPMKVKGVE